MLPKFTDSYSLCQYSSWLLCRNRWADSRICMELKEIKGEPKQFEKEEHSYKSDTFNFKTYCKAIAIKTVWYCNYYQCDHRIQSSEISPWVCDQLIFNKDASSKRLVFNKCACSTAQPRPIFVTPRLFCPWDFPDKNSGVGCHSLLQGIFLTQGLHPLLLHWQADWFFTTEPPRKPICVIM